MISEDMDISQKQGSISREQAINCVDSSYAIGSDVGSDVDLEEHLANRLQQEFSQITLESPQMNGRSRRQGDANGALPSEVLDIPSPLVSPTTPKNMMSPGLGITSPQSDMNLKQMVTSSDWNTRCHAYEALTHLFSQCTEATLQEYGPLLPKMVQDGNLSAQEAALNALSAWLDRGQGFRGKLKKACKPTVAAVVESALGLRPSLADAGMDALQKMMAGVEKDKGVWEALVQLTAENQRTMVRRGALEALMYGIEHLGAHHMQHFSSELIENLPSLLTSREVDLRLSSTSLCSLLQSGGQGNILCQLDLDSLPQRTRKQLEGLMGGKESAEVNAQPSQVKRSNSVSNPSPRNRRSKTPIRRSQSEGMYGKSASHRRRRSGLWNRSSSSFDESNSFFRGAGPLPAAISSALNALQGPSNQWDEKTSALESATASVKDQQEGSYDEMDSSTKSNLHTLLTTGLMETHIQVVKEAALLVTAAAEQWGGQLSNLAAEELFPRLLKHLGAKNHSVQQSVSDAATVVYDRCCSLSQIIELLGTFLANPSEVIREQTSTWLWWALQKCTRDFRQEPWVFEQLSALLVPLTSDRSKGCRDASCLVLAQIVAALASHGAELGVYKGVTRVISTSDSSEQIAFMAQSIEIDTSATDFDVSQNLHVSSLVPPQEVEEEEEEFANNCNKKVHQRQESVKLFSPPRSPRPESEDEVEVAVIVKLYILEDGSEQDIEACVSILPSSPITTVVDDILVHIEENLFQDQDVRLASLLEKTTQSEMNATSSVAHCMEKYGGLTLQMEILVGKDLVLERKDGLAHFSSGDELLESMLISYEEEGRGELSDDAMSIVSFREDKSEQLDMELKSLIICEEDAKDIVQRLNTPGTTLRQRDKEASQLLDECISMFGGKDKEEDILFSPGWTATDEAMIKHIVPASDEKTKRRLHDLRLTRSNQKSRRTNLADQFEVANSLSRSQVDSAAGTPVMRSASRSIFNRPRMPSSFQSSSKKDIIDSLERDLQQDSDTGSLKPLMGKERSATGDGDLGSVSTMSSVGSRSRRRQTFSTQDFDKINNNIAQALECLNTKDLSQQKKRLTTSGFLDGSVSGRSELDSPNQKRLFQEESSSRSHRMQRSAKLASQILTRTQSQGSSSSVSQGNDPVPASFQHKPRIRSRSPAGSLTSDLTMEYDYDSEEDYEDLRKCLERLHLLKHYQILRENEVTLQVLEQLTEQEMSEIGLPLGARKRLTAFRDQGLLLVSPAKPKRHSIAGGTPEHEPQKTLPRSGSSSHISRTSGRKSNLAMPPPPRRLPRKSLPI